MLPPDPHPRLFSADVEKLRVQIFSGMQVMFRQEFTVRSMQI